MDATAKCKCWRSIYDQTHLIHIPHICSLPKGHTGTHVCKCGESWEHEHNE